MPVYEDCLNSEEESHEFPLYHEGLSIAFNNISDAFGLQSYLVTICHVWAYVMLFGGRKIQKMILLISHFMLLSHLVLKITFIHLEYINLFTNFVVQSVTCWHALPLLGNDNL